MTPWYFYVLHILDFVGISLLLIAAISWGVLTLFKMSRQRKLMVVLIILAAYLLLGFLLTARTSSVRSYEPFEERLITLWGLPRILVTVAVDSTLRAFGFFP